jgi:hypothetical protein
VKKHIIINAAEEPDWLDMAKKALAELRPFTLKGDEQQIAKFLQYKRGVADKWQTEGMLKLEPMDQLYGGAGTL